MSNKKVKAEDKYEEKDLREGMTEIKTGRRVFDTEKYGLVQIRFPKVEENRLADWEYSKVFQQAILDGIPTNKEMQRLIDERSLWTKADDDLVESLREELNKQLVILSKMETEKNMLPVQEKINDIRQSIFNKQQERQRFFNNTAEAKADESKMSFLVSKCAEIAETGKPIWATYQDFKNEEDQVTVNVIVYQFLTFINGLPADFLSEPSASEDVANSEE